MTGVRRRLRRTLILFALGLVSASASADEPEPNAPSSVSPEAIEHFEKEVRPVLVERCLKCHGAEKQWASLRLDSREALLRGGDSGPAAAPGDADASELLLRVSETDETLRMPPAEAGEPLTARQIDALRSWIASGAAWPDEPAAAERPSADEHWAFQPIRRPAVPDVENEDWCRTPVDRFLLQRLEQQGLSLSHAADRRTLIRRVTFDLTGLPPTPNEVAAFIDDPRPDAYERLVDRLLVSPRYGEQWGRHWLDVARYSDTKGYVYAREERLFVHASGYRDWVIAAFNGDLPYDRFVRLQLAADQASDDPRDLAAMGFLTLGRRFLGVTHDVIDDRIDVTCRGLMGLTVACARCHDHKFDPIPTADYYSLYGVFRSSSERLEPVPRPVGTIAPSEEFAKELEKRKRQLADTTAAKREEAAERIRSRIADYLFAQTELAKYPELGFDQILAKDDLIPAIVHRWREFLAGQADARSGVFGPWFAWSALPADQFPVAMTAVDSSAINPRIAAAFAVPAASMRDVADRYGRVFSQVDREWRTLCEDAKRSGRPLPEALSDPAAEALRQVLYAPRSPCMIPDEPIVNTESLYDSGTVDELWKLQGEVDRWLLQAPETAPHAVILADSAVPTTPRIFRRGNPANRGDEVPRRFLALLAGADRQPFQHGSGRRELAEAIVDRRNPLTARVWVNRVWMHHFGAGLVRTPSDFGVRAEPPSHPELLDWLAAEFIAGGWSTKSLHRTILLSEAYRQRSDGPSDASLQTAARRVDPENRLLWRMNARRIGFEEMRDTLAAVSGGLDGTMGGKPVENFPGDVGRYRRSIYGLVDRQFVPGVMRAFDFANPDLHTPQRSETTVPQQALFAWNHPFVAGRARALAETANATSPLDRVERLYQAVLQRGPTASQRSAALAFVAAAETGFVADDQSAATKAWSYGYGEPDESTGRLKNFQALPFFSGNAWQGGANWPDPALGWVQLTADGGHPGNDLAHAAVRRWTAPRDGVVAVESVVTHEVAAGDGIRCRIVSSRHGLLASAAVHNRLQTMSLDHVEVRAGDTLDFITDIHANLNSDQFLWTAEVRLTDRAGGSADVWYAARDFSGPTTAALDPWAQLAQVLLMSNEFQFVD